MSTRQDLEMVLSAARRRSHELLDQASGYERRGFQATADETMEKHYKPLADAIKAVQKLSDGMKG